MHVFLISRILKSTFIGHHNRIICLHEKKCFRKMYQPQIQIPKLTKIVCLQQNTLQRMRCHGAPALCPKNGHGCSNLLALLEKIKKLSNIRRISSMFTSQTLNLKHKTSSEETIAVGVAVVAAAAAAGEEEAFQGGEGHHTWEGQWAEPW